MLKPKRILIVYYLSDGAESGRVTVQQHLHALRYCRVEHEIIYFNAFDIAPNYAEIDNQPEIPPDLLEKAFDVVLFHYTFLAFRTIGHYFSRWKQQFEWLNTYEALRIAIPQDEGNFAGLLDDWLYELNVQIIFSVHYSPDGPLYPIMRKYARIYPCLPGYIDENDANSLASRLRPLKERPYDIVYRARELPWCYGTAGRMKSLIADIISPMAVANRLCIDISTRYEDTLFGDKWWDFIASGRATIGSAGGYSVIDWRGEIKAQVELLLKKNPGICFDEFSDLMPAGWDGHHLLTITPRHFEAVITKTCQILVENSYKGILIPYRHYIPLKTNLSNVNEVLEQLRDVRFLQEITDGTYSEIFLKGEYTYRHFAYQIEDAIEEYQNRNVLKNGPPHMNLSSDRDDFEHMLAFHERQSVAQRTAQDRLQASTEQKYLDLIQQVAAIHAQMQTNHSQLYAVLQNYQNVIQSQIASLQSQFDHNYQQSKRMLHLLKLLLLIVTLVSCLTFLITLIR